MRYCRDLSAVFVVTALVPLVHAQTPVITGGPVVTESPTGVRSIWMPGAVAPVDIDGNRAVANAPKPGDTAGGDGPAIGGLRDEASWAPFGPSGADANSVSASPTVADLVIAGVASSVGGGGLYRSTNNGQSWSVASGTGSRAIKDVEFSGNGTGWAATGDGLFRSTDNGQTWTQVTLPIPGQALVEDVTVDPNNPSVIWIGLGQFLNGTSPEVVFRSSDEGNSWTDVSPPVTPGLGATVIAVDPANSQRVYAAFTGNFGSGNDLWVTTDGGTSWVERSAGLPDFMINDIAFAAAPSTTVYVAGGQDFGSQFLGLQSTSDDGQSWNELSADWPSRATTSIAVDPSNPQNILVGTTRAGVVRSTNGGASWTFSTGGTQTYQVNDIEFVRGSPSTVFLGMGSVAIFRSTDGGANFSPSASGMSRLELTSFAVNPLNTSEIAASYVGNNDGGIFVTTNAGQTWTLSQAPLPRWQKVYFGPDGTLYGAHDGPLGRADDGLWRRNSNGTWSNLGPGAPTSLDNIGYDIAATTGPNPKILFGASQWLGTWGARIWSYNRAAPDAWELEYDSFVSNEQVNSVLWLNNGAGPEALAGVVNFGSSGAGGIFRSTDSGDTWAPSESGFISGWSVWGLAQGPQNANTVYANATPNAGSGTGSTYKSTDGGVSWTQQGITPASRTFAVDSAIAGTIYIHPTWTNTGPQRSTDDGVTFELFNNGFLGGGARALVNGGTVGGNRKLYAATSSGGYATNLAPAGGCPVDMDNNGAIEPADVAAFVSTWFTSLTGGTLAGDFDGNGAVEPADVATFVSAWFTALTTGNC